MGNFADIAHRMQSAQAAKQVAVEGDLVAALAERLADPARARAEGERAKEFASAEDGVLAAVLDAIGPWLPV
jgi:3-deoxy-D-manno-octulosonic-acid transferase